MVSDWLTDNYYGTPKPAVEASSVLLIPGSIPNAASKRRRNKSVSNMEKAGLEPPEEEEEEETAVVNGNEVTATPGEADTHTERERDVWREINRQEN